MKYILFILTSFRHGGTNKSLENLLSLIDTEEYQVDVFAMEHFGPYKEMLPNCTILHEDKWLGALIAHYDDTKGKAQIRSFIAKILRKTGSILGVNITDKLYKNTSDRLLKSKNYDAVIAYSEGAPTALASHLNHPNKIAWIHCDYSSYMTLNNQQDETAIYKTYKSIVCVSEYTKGEFIKIMPGMREKVLSIHNMVNLNAIQKESKKLPLDKKFKKDSFTIITIGTFYAIKRLSTIPEIASQLQKRGCNFKWYVIAIKGDINEFATFNDNIKKFNTSESVIYLGEKKNPYSYLNNSNLFVSLSSTEACPYVINESKALHIPIVCTDFPSAPEFVENGKIGYITPIESIVDKIELLIKDKSVFQDIKSKMLVYNYNNKQLMDKFYITIKQ